MRSARGGRRQARRRAAANRAADASCNRLQCAGSHHGRRLANPSAGISVTQRVTGRRSWFDVDRSSNCGIADLPICRFADLRICGFADLRNCGIAELLIQPFSRSAVRRFGGSAVRRFGGSAVQRFSGSAVQRFSGSAGRRVRRSIGQRAGRSAWAIRSHRPASQRPPFEPRAAPSNTQSPCAPNARAYLRASKNPCHAVSATAAQIGTYVASCSQLSASPSTNTATATSSTGST
ncbi:hypothetical protein X946_1873 [Burkholderia sp. ABCPW 111]|nr:hypothetical protein X946_1873 [Burkholderia sp. ABCPW 111]